MLANILALSTRTLLSLVTITAVAVFTKAVGGGGTALLAGSGLRNAVVIGLGWRRTVKATMEKAS